jgi:translation initiation factor 1A
VVQDTTGIKDTDKPEGENQDKLQNINGEELPDESSRNETGPKKERGNTEEFTFVRVKLPHRNKGEMFAIAEQLMGGSRLKIICEDGKSRMARIPGKMKKRRWIRTGDLLIIKPWEFQDEKADVVRRYTKTESSNLSRRGVIPDNINVF